MVTKSHQTDETEGAQRLYRGRSYFADAAAAEDSRLSSS
jgi:hypothetical protein